MWQWKSNTIIPSKNKWSFFQSYPEELQLKTEHFENPLAPYDAIITYDMLSQSAKKIMQKNGIKSKHYSQKKLIADFRDRWVDKKIVKTETKETREIEKSRQNDSYIILFIFHRLSYTCHIENLQYYIRKGMKLLKVNSIISFDQTDFAKNYISMTTALRASSSSKVRKKMWKFYNNVLFGKSLQDAAKNIDVDIVWNNSKANTKIKSSRFRGRQILDPDTLAISTTPPKISRRMAFAVGFSILEFSKLEMYQVSCTLGWRKKICQVWDSNPRVLPYTSSWTRGALDHSANLT